MGEASPGARGHLLVVDDEPAILDAISILLELEGYRVSRAPDGQVALDLLRTLQPDLVLTDLMMPKLDGVGLARAVRADPALAAIPLVLTSAAIVRLDELEDLFDAFLPKDGHIDRLLAVLEERLSDLGT